MTGVIAHVANPTRAHIVELAVEAERAGARWIGAADAFWWRDVWMLLQSVGEATSTIEIGPVMTNAYLRHPFHTASALATLHEVAPGRVFCGIAAGGSEVSVAAGIDRRDAPSRSLSLARLLTDVSGGAPLDRRSGRSLDVELPSTPLLMAGRGDEMLRAVGEAADRVLLWAIPDSDLDRSVAVIRRAAATVGRHPQLIWAPIVAHADVAPTSLGHPAVYAALNTAAPIRRAWGLDDDTVAAIRSHLVAGRLVDAIAAVPAAAMRDLVLDPGEVDRLAERATSLGVTEIAVPGFAAATVAGHLAWAAEIESRL